MVVLDEAYIEFSDEPSRMGWVLQHANLVVLRTFSKSAALAGTLPAAAATPASPLPQMCCQPALLLLLAVLGEML